MLKDFNENSKKMLTNFHCLQVPEFRISHSKQCLNEIRSDKFTIFHDTQKPRKSINQVWPDKKCQNATEEMTRLVWYSYPLLYFSEADKWFRREKHRSTIWIPQGFNETTAQEHTCKKPLSRIALHRRLSIFPSSIIGESSANKHCIFYSSFFSIAYWWPCWSDSRMCRLR